MNLPWRNNEKLIHNLYNQLQEIREYVKAIENKKEFEERVAALENRIANNVLKQISGDLGKTISRDIMEELKRQKVGLC